MTDFLVIGAGLVGLTSALQLQKEGFRVKIVDRKGPGLGTSYGNAGVIATIESEPLANPHSLMQAPFLLFDKEGALKMHPGYMLNLFPFMTRFVMSCLPSRVESGDKALHSLNSNALGAWKRCLKSIGAEKELVKSGLIMVWQRENAIRDIKSFQANLRDKGLESQLLEGDEIQSHEPQLNSSIRYGLLFPNVYHVSEPYRVSTCLFEALKKNGAEFIEEDIKTVKVNPSNVEAKSENITLRASKLLIACGAESAKLATELGVHVPLEAEAGHHIMMPERKKTLNHIVTSADSHIYMTPMISGLRVTGFSEWGGLNLKPNLTRYNTLAHIASGILRDSVVLNDATTWTGFRPTLPDYLPVIGRHPQYPEQVYFAFGHQHLGVTQSAITAELIAAIAKGRAPKVDLAPFRPDRF